MALADAFIIKEWGSGFFGKFRRTPRGQYGPGKFPELEPKKSSGYHDPSYKPGNYRSEEVADHVRKLKTALRGATNPHERAKLQKTISDLEGALYNEPRSSDKPHDQDMLSTRVRVAASKIKSPQYRDQFETAADRLEKSGATVAQWQKLLQLAQDLEGR